MVTTFKAPNSGAFDEKVPYSKKQEIDTRIPPKAKPIFDKISVNGVVIPESDILQEAQNHPAETPGEALLYAARALVIRELLWQEANKKGIVCNQAEIAGQTKLDAAIATLLDREIDTPKATENDCKTFYERNPSRFLTNTIWEVRHILVGANRQDKAAFDDARMKADVILEQVKKNIQDFATIAQNISSCPSASEGGNLGQITPGSTVPEFENALKKAKNPGLLLQPIASRYGYHIVDISRIIQGKPLPFDLVKEKIAAWLEASSWSKAVQQYIAILAAGAHITGIEVRPNEGSLVQ